MSPFKTPLLAAMLSINIPIVILEGKAWGLIIISGTIPDSEKGISTYGHNIDITPFYPCLDENLSPITGFLLTLNLTITLISYSLLFTIAI